MMAEQLGCRVGGEKHESFVRVGPRHIRTTSRMAGREAEKVRGVGVLLLLGRCAHSSVLLAFLVLPLGPMIPFLQGFRAEQDWF